MARRRGQTLQRISSSTVDKLEEIRRRSLRHWTSRDSLIAELADKALAGGLPLLTSEAASRVKATGRLRAPQKVGAAAGAPAAARQ